MGRRTLSERITFTPTDDLSDDACEREAAALADAISTAVARMAMASVLRGEVAVGPMRIVIEQDVEPARARTTEGGAP